MDSGIKNYSDAYNYRDIVTPICKGEVRNLASGEKGRVWDGVETSPTNGVSVGAYYAFSDLAIKCACESVC